MAPASKRSLSQLRNGPRWLMPIIVALLIFGIGLRFTELDGKFFWIDEMMTVMRSSGHQVKPFYDNWFDNRIIPIQAVQYFQQVQPGGSFQDTITALATEDAKHPPLFFLMVRAWCSVFGSSVVSLRTMAAIASLLIFPSIYWFCRVLFPQQPLVAKLSLGLVAVSPIYLLYAQEARAYNIWLVAVLISSTVLLQATFQPSWPRWVAYVALVSFGIYNHTMFVIVLFSQGLYALLAGWIHRKSQPTWRGFPALWAQYLGALTTILLLFSPWLITILTTLRALSYTTSWVTDSIPTSQVLQQWLLGICSPFFDRGDLKFFRVIGDAEVGQITYWPYLLLLTGLLGSLVYLYRHAPRHASILLLCIIGGPVLWLLLPDLLLGGQRSITPRYWLAAYSALSIALAYVFAQLLSRPASLRQFRELAAPSRLGAYLWPGLLAVMFTLQLSSCLNILQASTWWSKYPYDFPEVAAAINAVDRPLVISDQTGANPGYLISLSYMIKPGVDLQLVQSPELAPLPEGYDAVFLFDNYTEAEGPLHELYSQSQGVPAVPIAANMLWQLQLPAPALQGDSK